VAVLAELTTAVRERAETLLTEYPGIKLALTGTPALNVAELDSIAKPWEHFDYGYLITSRGCPGQCTFCSSPQLWGRKVRFRSAENVLEEIEELVTARGHRFLNIKDDTFTAGRKRLLAICGGIVERGLAFRWVCDTRVDLVDPEMLAAMRRAGCMRLNLGIESGSPEILRNIKKRIDLDEAASVTGEARKLGMDVRFYLILGNRGETPETVRETLDFVERARPTSCLMHGLVLFPGTEEFELARGQGLVSAEDYFSQTGLGEGFFNMGERSARMENVLRTLAPATAREKPHTPYTTAEREQILARHPDLLLSYTDLAIDYAEQWRLDDAERVLQSALEKLGGQAPVILHHLACVAIVRNDMPAAEAYFDRAFAASPRDTSLLLTRQILQAAGPLNYQTQGQLAANLLTNLRSTACFFLPDDARQVTLAPDRAED
jgi:hypothetical protein